MPSLRARVVALKGVPVDQVHVKPGSQWGLQGDRGLTYAAAVPRGSTVVAGAWWPADYDGPPLVSLDAGLADGWGLAVGDTIRVNVLGRDIDLRVASLRAIQWRQLNINFTMVASPGLLAHAPHMNIATVREPAAADASLLRAVTDALPNVTGVRVADILQAVADLVGKLAAALAATGSVTLASGALVLAGAVAAGQRRRVAEAVVLKTLGATRRADPGGLAGGVRCRGGVRRPDRGSRRHGGELGRRALPDAGALVLPARHARPHGGGLRRADAGFRLRRHRGSASGAAGGASARGLSRAPEPTPGPGVGSLLGHGPACGWPSGTAGFQGCVGMVEAVTPRPEALGVEHSDWLELHAEQVVVAKRRSAELVRVTTQTRSREAVVDEALVNETVTVERVPVGRYVDSVPAVRQEGDVTVMPVVEEELVVTRRLFLREEVRVHRARLETRHVETVTVREQVANVSRTAVQLTTANNIRSIDGVQIPEKQIRGTTMDNETIVAVYDTASAADAAVADLRAANVPESAITRHSDTSAAGSGMTAATTGMAGTATASGTEGRGFWSSLFGTDDVGSHSDAAVYDRSVQSGSAVVVVKGTPAHDIDAVVAILEKHSPIDLDERASGYGLSSTSSSSSSASATSMGAASMGAASMGVGSMDAGTTGATTGLAGAGMTTASATATPSVAGGMVGSTARADDGMIQLSEEQIAIGKRVINRGGTRIRRYVVETPVEESVRLQEEKVTLERRPVTDGRPVGRQLLREDHRDDRDRGGGRGVQDGARRRGGRSAQGGHRAYRDGPRHRPQGGGRDRATPGWHHDNGDDSDANDAAYSEEVAALWPSPAVRKDRGRTFHDPFQELTAWAFSTAFLAG